MVKIRKIGNYFEQAEVVAKMSPDAETQVGALLVHNKTGAVLASGFNGFIRGADDLNLPNTRPLKYDFIIHAETNLLFNCARHGINTSDCTLFCTLSPCKNCMRSCYQAGINTIYFKKKYRDFNENVRMGDLDVTLTTDDGYYKIELSPARKYK